MKAQIECFGCNIRQAQEAAAVVCPERDFLWRVSQKLCMVYAHADPNWTPAYMTSLAHKIAREMTGVDDIYAQHKKHYNQLALKLYPELQRFVGEGDGALERAVRVAIVGNIIDLGVYREIEAAQILDQLYHVQWGLCDFALFEDDVRKAKTIVYVGDNAGEIVFDKILLRELKKIGVREIFFVVKGGPVSNDALLADFWEVGLNDFAQVLTTGKDECGVVPEEGPLELQEVWKRADLVISKGQGNFESLSGRKEKIYFLLKAKCVPVAREFGVEQGALILKRNHAVVDDDGSSLRRVYSSGGVVLRKRGETVEVLLVQKRDSGVWTLPKGHLDDGETEAEAAEREVHEETGYKVSLREKIGEIQFTYRRNGECFEEIASFFLMDPVEAGRKEEEQEIGEVSWFSLPQALTVMQYENEKKIVIKGGEMFQKC